MQEESRLLLKGHARPDLNFNDLIIMSEDKNNIINNTQEVENKNAVEKTVESSVVPMVEKSNESEKTKDQSIADKPKFGKKEGNQFRSKPPMQRRRGGKRNTRRRSGDRVKSEFDQKVVDIRRVTRVVAGGRRFSFSVALVAGDRKGRVGVGLGKSPDTASAIEKAARNAKKNMIKVNLTKDNSIPHEVEAKFASTRIIVKPSPGKGLVAGSSVRNVLDLAGVKDVSSKILSRSKNKFNNARAAVEALKQF